MTKRQLVERLSVFPDNADVVLVNSSTLERSEVSFITWKNSAERINLYYDTKEHSAD